MSGKPMTGEIVSCSARTGENRIKIPLTRTAFESAPKVRLRLMYGEKRWESRRMTL